MEEESSTVLELVERADWCWFCWKGKREVRQPPQDTLLTSMRELGVALREAREYVRFTQEELAQKIGRTQSTVSKSETGKIEVSEDYVRAVYEACGFSETEEWAELMRRLEVDVR